MNAASWLILNRSLRNFAPEQELSCRAASKSGYTPFLNCSQWTLKSYNFHFGSAPAGWSQQGKREKSSLARGGMHAGKPIKVNCLWPLSQKKGKRQSRKIRRKVLTQWPCVGCKKQKPLASVYRSELNSCEKAVWDFSQASVNSDQSQSLRMKSLLRGWFYVQALTLLSLFSCWPYQTELQATFVQHPTCAFHKLAVAEHLAHWMLQVCYFISPCDLFELPSCNPIPQL